jgi:dethiobiotin synthetase
MTPLTEKYSTLDYIRIEQYPVFLVTTPRLGSINHTLMTLEMCRYADIPVKGVIYNMFNVEDELICEDTKDNIRKYLEKYMRKTTWCDLKDGVLEASTLD